jgi:hypothetical protein
MSLHRFFRKNKTKLFIVVIVIIIGIIAYITYRKFYNKEKTNEQKDIKESSKIDLESCNGQNAEKGSETNPEPSVESGTNKIKGLTTERDGYKAKCDELLRIIENNNAYYQQMQLRMQRDNNEEVMNGENKDDEENKDDSNDDKTNNDEIKDNEDDKDEKNNKDDEIKDNETKDNETKKIISIDSSDDDVQPKEVQPKKARYAKKKTSYKTS